MRGITPLLERWLGNLLARQFEGMCCVFASIDILATRWCDTQKLGNNCFQFPQQDVTLRVSPKR